VRARALTDPVKANKQSLNKPQRRWRLSVPVRPYLASSHASISSLRLCDWHAGQAKGTAASALALYAMCAMRQGVRRVLR
jgi:hypothetical protein